MKNLFLLLFILTTYSIQAQNYTLSGYMKDAENGEELIGASLYVPATKGGQSTNYYGYYSISLPKGTYKVEYSYLGYETVVKTITLNKDIVKNVELSISAEMLNTVVVSTEARDKNVSSTEMGTQTLQMQEIKQIPVLFGENDVLKTIQLMPGVKGAGEGNSGYYVRGGGADQNLILLDEAPVYNASHMLGFFSVFNGDAIKDVKLYKGSMPAEYGGRLSSVLDIKMKEGNNKNYHANGGIGTISSRLAVEGPLKKDTSSFIIAGRRTYADMFLKFAKDTALHSTQLYFYDLNLKTNYTFNKNNRLFLSGYFGRDIFAFQDLFGTDWGNATGTARWVHLFTPKLFLNSTVVYSQFNNKIGMDGPSGKFDLQSGIEDWHLKEDFQYYGTNNKTFKFGLDVIHHTFSPGDLKYIPATEGVSEINVNLDKKYAIEAGAYISTKLNLTDRLKVDLGLRYSSFSIIAEDLGLTNSYIYDDGHDPIDTIQYEKGSIIKNYPGIEPRFAGTYQLNLTSSIKGSFTMTNQYVHLIQSSTTSMPSDYWIPSTENTPPQQCTQYSIGYFRNYEENKYETSVELYYKDLKSQIDYESGTNIFLEPDLESYLLFGDGKSYGAELLFKKSAGDLTGWVGYTWSRTEKQFSELNKGKWFPTRYDRTHDVSIVAMYKVNKKLQLSATWIYNTGDAVTLPSGKYIIDGKRVNYFTERNGYRMPDYHRMDLGATYQLKKTKKYESMINLSIYNLYSRKNAYMIYFEPVTDDNEDVLQAVKVTLFPILPSITWNFKF